MKKLSRVVIIPSKGIDHSIATFILSQNLNEGFEVARVEKMESKNIFGKKEHLVFILERIKK